MKQGSTSFSMIVWSSKLSVTNVLNPMTPGRILSIVTFIPIALLSNAASLFFIHIFFTGWWLLGSHVISRSIFTTLAKYTHTHRTTTVNLPLILCCRIFNVRQGSVANLLFFYTGDFLQFLFFLFQEETGVYIIILPLETRNLCLYSFSCWS